MKKIKNLHCSATLAQGILTLDNGSQIDFAKIGQAIESIAISAVNSQQSSPQSVARELDWCVSEAQGALQHLSQAIGAASDSTPRRELDGVRDVFIEAYETPYGSSGDGPAYALLKVNQEFINKLRRLAKLCTLNNLTELRIGDGPEMWGPVDVSDYLRLTSPELVVTPTSFWFTDQPPSRAIPHTVRS